MGFKRHLGLSKHTQNRKIPKKVLRHGFKFRQVEATSGERLLARTLYSSAIF